MASATEETAGHPYTVADLGRSELQPTYRVDLRTAEGPDVFEPGSVTDWKALSWEKVGRPYRVERWSKEKRRWEREHGEEMPAKLCWEQFNRSFQHLFDSDSLAERRASLRAMFGAAGSLRLAAAWHEQAETTRWSVWNHVHRVEDAVWDPRGKRALFAGLGLERPRILFLGAADGYEAMQLWATYPGGQAVLVDYDDYCRTDRFGRFPTSYPFLGADPATGGPRVWYRDEMAIDFVVSDIRDLPFGREFDVVLSVGLIEHFPDQYKPLALEWHRKFLKPGGVAIMTTPRLQVRAKLFYTIFADVMNFAYRELMDVTHLGLYAYENGFEVVRHGRLKAHNGMVARVR
jgi:hypothetical protein